MFMLFLNRDMVKDSPRYYEHVTTIYSKMMRAKVIFINDKIYKDDTKIFKDESLWIGDVVAEFIKMKIDPSSDNDLLILTTHN